MINNDYWKIIGNIEEELEIDNSTNIDEDFYSTNLKNIFNNSNKENVLCVGQVQSGKTKNIEKIISHAIENEYDLIIFLAGITRLLLTQTINRIKNSINETNVKFVDDKSNEIDLFLDLKYYKTTIVPILKGSKSINKIFTSIDSLDLTNKKVLIIDDECDYASINISKSKDSKIYSLLKELYLRIHYGKLISFTGTPFANIMCSKNDIIEPNRIVTLINYDSYCGLKYFNKNKDLNYIAINDNKDTISNYLINDSLYVWLVSTSCALLEDNEFKSELLINIDVENYAQKDFYTRIFMTLKQARKDPNAIKKRLEKIYYKFFDFEYNFEKIFDLSKEIINYFFDKEINIEHKIVLLNSENKESSKFKSGYCKFCIIVSGFMASRGFTFENLTTELFLNVPNGKIAIDTLLQRCRWFGPRLKNNRNKYLRIILNERTKSALLEAEKYLDVFIPGTSTINIKDIYSKIHELDRENSEVESTNGTKRK